MCHVSCTTIAWTFVLITQYCVKIELCPEVMKACGFDDYFKKHVCCLDLVKVFGKKSLKVDMHILTCIFSLLIDWPWPLKCILWRFTLRYIVASCLLSRGKRKYAPLGMRLLWKYIRNYFLVYHLISHFLLYLQNYKEFETEILDLQSEKYGLLFDIKKYATSGWALGDENVIGIRAFNGFYFWTMNLLVLAEWIIRSVESQKLVFHNLEGMTLYRYIMSSGII